MINTRTWAPPAVSRSSILATSLRLGLGMSLTIPRVLSAVLASLRVMLVIMKSVAHELHLWIRILLKLHRPIDLEFRREVLVKCHHGIVHREGL